MKPPNPPSGSSREGGGDGRVYPVILLSYVFSGTDRINLGKGKVGGAWKVYPIILLSYRGVR